MADLNEIVAFLDRELRTSSVTDYPGAMNGLQLANDGEIARVVAAVDASLPVIESAAAGGPGLLLVHHGMFWQGAQPVTGPFYRKLKTAMEAGLAVYSSHLPLDIHPEHGNNILLAKSLGLKAPEPFFEKNGMPLGVRGGWEGTREDLAEALRRVLHGNVHLCPAGPAVVRTVGLITGGAGSEVAQVSRMGLDAFITGEGPHWSYTLAEELEINLLYGGHYATETPGVQSIAGLVATKFGLPWKFLDHPTGL